MSKLRIFLVFAAAAVAAAFAVSVSAAPGDTTASTPPSDASLKTAVFAGGCFWCVESDFDKLEGVKNVVSGYTGGDSQSPTYRNHKGHVEAAEITYDPSVVTFRQLTDYLFRHVDPLDDGGQFCDRGPSYETAIFVANADERAAAEASKKEAEKLLGEKVVTPIRDLKKFWIAEDYHQDYYQKNPGQYRYYRSSCGRDRRVHQLWDGKE